MARRPTADELDLWRKVVADTEPLTPERKKALMGTLEQATVPELVPKQDGKQKPSAAAAPRHHIRPTADPGLGKVKVPSALAEHDPGRAPGIDRRTSLKIKRGKQQIDGRIDLHGMRQDEAHNALNAFINGAYKRGDRCVLVITGKGTRGGDGEREAGVLRRMTPRWLTDGGNKEKVLAYSPAQPMHGGSGALYVMLRRRRDRK